MGGGGIGLIVGAAGSLISSGNQRRAARAQRKQIDLQIQQAKNDHLVQVERFEVTKAAAADAYRRERILLDSQRDLATLQQREQQLLSQESDRQLTQQQQTLKAQAEQQVQQLLASKANAQTQADIASGQVLEQLASVFDNAVNASNQIEGVVGTRGVDTSGLQDALALEGTESLQRGLRTVNTLGRQAQFVGDSVNSQIADTQASSQIARRYLQGTQLQQRTLNDLIAQYTTTDLDRTYQRNQIAAEANQFAQQAGILGQQGAASLNLRNRINELNMARTQIRSPGFLETALSVGSQILPLAIGAFSRGGGGGSSSGIVSSNLTPPQPSGIMGSTPQYYPYSPTVGSPGILTDVTGNVFG